MKQEVDEEYKTYLDSLPEGQKPQGHFAFRNTAIKQHFEDATEEEKTAVKEYRKKDQLNETDDKAAKNRAIQQ